MFFVAPIIGANLQKMIPELPSVLSNVVPSVCHQFPEATQAVGHHAADVVVAATVRDRSSVLTLHHAVHDTFRPSLWNLCQTFTHGLQFVRIEPLEHRYGIAYTRITFHAVTLQTSSFEALPVSESGQDMAADAVCDPCVKATSAIGPPGLQPVHYTDEGISVLFRVLHMVEALTIAASPVSGMAAKLGHLFVRDCFHAGKVAR